MVAFLEEKRLCALVRCLQASKSGSWSQCTLRTKRLEIGRLHEEVSSKEEEEQAARLECDHEDGGRSTARALGRAAALPQTCRSTLFAFAS